MPPWVVFHVPDGALRIYFISTCFNLLPCSKRQPRCGGWESLRNLSLVLLNQLKCSLYDNKTRPSRHRLCQPERLETGWKFNLHLWHSNMEHFLWAGRSELKHKMIFSKGIHSIWNALGLKSFCGALTPLKMAWTTLNYFFNLQWILINRMNVKFHKRDRCFQEAIRKAKSVSIYCCH